MQFPEYEIELDEAEDPELNGVIIRHFLDSRLKNCRGNIDLKISKKNKNIYVSVINDKPHYQCQVCDKDYMKKETETKDDVGPIVDSFLWERQGDIDLIISKKGKTKHIYSVEEMNGDHVCINCEYVMKDMGIE